MEKIKRIIAVTMLVMVASVSTVPAFAAKPTTSPSPKPGNGFGDKNHEHTGPPGQKNRPSDRPDDHVKASVSFVVMAEGSAKAVVEAITGILHSIHFS